jgi:hypothetical protein
MQFSICESLLFVCYLRFALSELFIETLVELLNQKCYLMSLFFANIVFFEDTKSGCLKIFQQVMGDVG